MQTFYWRVTSVLGQITQAYREPKPKQTSCYNCERNVHVCVVEGEHIVTALSRVVEKHPEFLKVHHDK